MSEDRKAFLAKMAALAGVSAVPVAAVAVEAEEREPDRKYYPADDVEQLVGTIVRGYEERIRDLAERRSAWAQQSQMWKTEALRLRNRLEDAHKRMDRLKGQLADQAVLTERIRAQVPAMERIKVVSR